MLVTLLWGALFVGSVVALSLMLAAAGRVKPAKAHEPPPDPRNLKLGLRDTDVRALLGPAWNEARVGEQGMEWSFPLGELLEDGSGGTEGVAVLCFQLNRLVEIRVLSPGLSAAIPAGEPLDEAPATLAETPAEIEAPSAEAEALVSEGEAVVTEAEDPASKAQAPAPSEAPVDATRPSREAQPQPYDPSELSGRIAAAPAEEPAAPTRKGPPIQELDPDEAAAFLAMDAAAELKAAQQSP